MSTLNITIVQSLLHWHDAEKNRQMFGETIRNIDDDSDLIVLPEMFTTGFTMDAKKYSETMDGPTMEWLSEAAASSESVVCGSIIAHDDGRYLNRFIFMRPDGSYQTYDKKHLFRLADEHRYFDAGNELLTVELNGWRIRPMVCYDLRFPVWSRNNADYDLLLYVANWPSPRHLAWETLLKARAIENQAYVAGVNRTGRDGNDHLYSGGSAVIDYMGNALADLGDEITTATIRLEMDPLTTFRDRYPFHIDADHFALTDT